MLQEIKADYPTAEGARRSDLLSKYNMLHRISDNVMDEWLVFAEKLSEFREQADFQAPPDELPEEEAPELGMDAFVRGQGYYKLLMYRKCIEQFRRLRHSIRTASLPACIWPWLICRREKAIPPGDI